jgi:deoxycytidylate deaminase
MIIIAMVGPFGSGCSYVAHIIEEIKTYTYLSLSEQLRIMYREQYPENELTRSAQQEYGNYIREKEGCDYLAKKVWNIIQSDPSKNYVIDGIKNPEEVKYLKSMHPDFFLLGIFADPVVRWKRIEHIYKRSKNEFDNDDNKDSGKNENKYGQHVTDTFRMSDIIILNNEALIKNNDKYNSFVERITDKLKIIEKKAKYIPEPDETYMTMAYAASMRSSCLKRKVGAAIVDEYGNVFSSGYNEVPLTQRSCHSEYAGCYRDKLKLDFKNEVNKCISNETERDTVYSLFKSSFKILDYCRALHAEENAILNVARIGTSNALAKSTLYTTTYPCNLCANKIAQVGISCIVYFEPYPQEEAKKILEDNDIKQRPFEGVTYNGYFRLMEEIDNV